MVEIPSVAVAADHLAKEADFFSIGSNDLTQYTLAVDRTNERVANLFRPSNPGVTRLLRQVVREGTAAGIRVSICGEMASEKPYTLLLLARMKCGMPRCRANSRSFNVPVTFTRW